jgi:hypothetical protein
MAATPAIAPFVPALSVMLAAYGFFYNNYKSRIDAAADIGKRAADPVALRRQVAIVKQGLTAAIVLAVVPIVVWLLLLKETVDEVEAAIDVHFSLSHYSTLDVVFVVLANAWLGIAVAAWLQVRPLKRKLLELEDAKPKAN